MMKRTLVAVLVAVGLSVSVLGCGGGADGVTLKAPGSETAIDDDPVALLPGSPVAIGSVDLAAFFTNSGFGKAIGVLIDTTVPLGEESKIVPSRDMKKVVWGSYSFQGADVVAVVRGEFNDVELKRHAETKTPVKNGALLVMSRYSDHDLFTVNNTGFCILTPRTALVGTEGGIRRALDRVKDGRVKRDAPMWMLQELATEGAEFTIAGDFLNQPGSQEVLKQLPVGWLNGMSQLRVEGDFKAPGVNLTATLTYLDEAKAQSASAQMQAQTHLAKMAGVMGLPVPQNIAIKADKADVHVSFSVDEAGIRALAEMAPRYLKR